MESGRDRITTEVIAHRFAAAADEMMATLVKTAYPRTSRSAATARSPSSTLPAISSP